MAPSGFPKEDYADAKEPQSETDSDNDSIFSQILTSMLSTDNFLDNVPAASKSGDAWNAYDDDSLLAGNDNHKTFMPAFTLEATTKSAHLVLYSTARTPSSSPMQIRRLMSA